MLLGEGRELLDICGRMEVEVYVSCTRMYVDIYVDIRRSFVEMCLIDSNGKIESVFERVSRGIVDRVDTFEEKFHAVFAVCTVCDTLREEVKVLIRVESKNRVEIRTNWHALGRSSDNSHRNRFSNRSRVKNFKRKRRKEKIKRKERRKRAKSGEKKGANNGSGVSLRGNRRRVLERWGLKMGLPGLINHRQSRESASKRPRPLKVNDENFVTGRSVRAIVDRGGPVICFHSTPFPRQGTKEIERTNG